MNICSIAFDHRLRQIEHFDRYPMMLPHVGSEYERDNHKRLLIIAESHYLPPESTVHHDPAAWYSGSSDRMKTPSDDPRWIDCRYLVAMVNHPIFRNLKSALNEARKPNPLRDDVFKMVAYMNCFQRPARNVSGGRSFSRDLKDLDLEKSAGVLRQVIDAIQPQMVCFVSSFSWRTVGRDLARVRPLIQFGYTPHPARQWWHRRSIRGTGKEQFVAFARQWLSS
jgi:hypothetical protein